MTPPDLHDRIEFHVDHDADPVRIDQAVAEFLIALVLNSDTTPGEASSLDGHNLHEAS